MKPPAIVIQLIHMEGPLKGQIQEFNQPEIFIGRSDTCQVRFPKDLGIVSRVHARIFREGNRFMLADQSTNGTFVNGKPAKDAILKDGDILLFAEGGPKVSFLTQTIEGAADAADSVQPSFSAHISPLPLQAASPPPIPSPMPPPQKRVDAPQPVSAWSESPPRSPKPSIPESAPEQHSGDIPVLQVQKPLVVQYGPTLKSYNVVPVTIGSGPLCDFRLDHPAVLERHAQIFYFQDQYWIKDLTGKNLVRINGRSVEGQAMLEPDHRLSLSAQGPDFRFLGGGRLAEIEAVAADAPAPATDGNASDPQKASSGSKGIMDLGAMMKKMLKK